MSIITIFSCPFSPLESPEAFSREEGRFRLGATIVGIRALARSLEYDAIGRVLEVFADRR